ncbi:Fibronectin-binding protein (FBP) [Rhodococcus coprophilus]|uniref:Fibronectin-binding protein (FBP) n=1 Tax=Rhodococcus coprophilus TaxID=38310 RepID=A0A2X4TSE7_9NOCA|nr:Fibronectin-binding protein (FBP) [Rhodococcus coprophilus]
MEAITERDIRASFVNCSKGEAKRLPAPRDLAERPWEDLDFLGWTDPSFPGRGYLVVPREDGPVGIAMRFEPNGSGKSQMCTVCLTTHSRGGVALMTAAKVGDSGRAGNTLGTYMCIDLACSLYARGKKEARARKPVSRRSRARREDCACTRESGRIPRQALPPTRLTPGGSTEQGGTGPRDRRGRTPLTRASALAGLPIHLRRYFAARSLTTRSASGRDDAGFCPVYRFRSTTKWGCHASPEEKRAPASWRRSCSSHGALLARPA